MLSQTRPASFDHKEIAVLLGRVSSGDHAAFAQVYDHTLRRAYAAAFAILRDRAETDDAVQEGYLCVWENAARFNPELSDGCAWITTLCRNKALDRWRARVRYRTHLVDQVQYREILACDDSRIQRAEREQHVHAAMSTLSISDRTLITSVFFRNETHARIAADQQRPLGTIKARVRRALLKLRAQLSTYGVEASVSVDGPG